MDIFEQAHLVGDSLGRVWSADEQAPHFGKVDVFVALLGNVGLDERVEAICALIVAAQDAAVDSRR